MTKLLKLGTVLLATFALVACGESGGNEGGESGNESLPINQEQAEQKVEELSVEGFYIKFSYETQSDGSEASSGTMYYGYKGDTYWLGSGDFEIACHMGETKYDYYRKEEGAWKYSSSSDKAQAEQYGLDKAYLTMVTNWFYWGNTYDGQLTKGKDQTVAGRSCYTYTYDFNSELDAATIAAAAAQGVDLTQYSLKYEIAIDKQIGITMKVSVSGSSTEGSGSLHYEVIEFKTGSQVTVPTLPAAVPTED